jgi:hypothetical protein
MKESICEGIQKKEIRRSDVVVFLPTPTKQWTPRERNPIIKQMNDEKWNQNDDQVHHIL